MSTTAFASPRQVDGIVDGRRRLGMSALALWIGYLAVGGDGSLSDVTAWLAGTTRLSIRDYDLLVQAMNYAFVSLGLDHQVPYSHE